MPSRVCSLAATILVVSALALGPTRAHADGVADEADLQFQLGAAAYAQRDFLGALEHFLASNRLVPNRNVMFNTARAFEQLGRFPDAYRYYVDALRGESDATVKRDVEAAIARISPEVAVVELESTPPGAVVYIDRRDLGSVGATPARLGLATGTYMVVLELAGYEPMVRGPFELAVGTRTTVEAELELIVGTLQIEGVAGTEVRLDDEAAPVACVTPCSLDVTPGAHQLFFSRAGFRATPRAVNAIANRAIQVTADLTTETGSLLVSTDEPNALIEIDGERVGFAPTVLTGIAVGRRTVRVSLRGYQPIERIVEVRADQQVDLANLSMNPLREVSAASRETQRIEDAPASVTIIEGQELEAFGYPTILEALRGIRGFAMNYDSIYGNAAVRGLGQANDYNNRLLVLSDGAVLNENILYQPFIHYDGRTDLGDVERIEIVRGPASVLYGTGAVSGVVNLVMRGQDLPTGAHAQISTYDGSTARARGDAVYRVNETTGAWLSLAAARSDGRDADLVFDDDGDGPSPQAPQTAHDFDKFNSWTATGKTWWKQLTLQAFYTSRRLIVPTGAYAAIFDDPRNYADDRRFLAELKYEAKVAPRTQLTLRSYLNWAYYHQDARFDVTEDPSMPADQRYIETYRGWWTGAEARLTVALSDRVRLAVGTEATLHTKVAMRTGQFEDDGSFDGILDVNAPYQVAAGYALLDWKPSSQVAVSAGARFDYWNLSGNENALPGESNVVTSFPALSPRVAVIAKPTDRDVIKLMGGTAFRAPSAYEYYFGDNAVTQAPSDVCGETLEPENVYSVELEASRRFTRDWVGLAAAHTTYAQNIVETVLVPMEARCGNDAGQIDPSVSYYRNSTVGQLVIGADVELRREWRSGTMLSAHYGLLRPRYTDQPDSMVNDRRLPNAPSQLAAIKAVVPIVPSLASIALRVSFEDRRRIETSTTERTERAVVADAVVSGAVASSGLRYSFGVYNLFNWQYSLPAFPFASNLMPQAGRSILVSIGVSM